MHAPALTVLLPANDEEKALPIVIEGIRRALSDAPGGYEILVVDDGSADRTADVARAGGARVVRHDRRRGAGAAVKTGVIEAKGHTIVLMDADATYPPDAIPALLAALDGSRQAIGARREEAGTARLLRAAVKFLLRRLGEFLVRQPIPDLNSGMRAFRRADAMAFLHLLPDGHSCVSTLTLCFIGMGLPVRFVPIDYHPRVGTSKFRVVTDTLRFLVQIVRSVAYFAPLRVFLSASCVFFAAAVWKSARDWSRTGGIEESDIILFTFGAVTGVMGLLADLVVRQSRKAILDDLFGRDRGNECNPIAVPSVLKGSAAPPARADREEHR